MRKTKFQQAARKAELFFDGLMLCIVLLFSNIYSLFYKGLALFLWMLFWSPAKIKSIKLYLKAKRNLRNKDIAKKMSQICMSEYKSLLTNYWRDR